MAISFVGSVLYYAGTSYGTGANTRDTTAADTIFIAYTADGYPFSPPAGIDDQGNTYINDTEARDVVGAFTICMFRCTNPTKSSSHAWKSLRFYTSVYVQAAAGVDQSTPLDDSSTSGGTGSSGTNIQPGQVDPTAGDDLILGAAIFSTGTSAHGITGLTSFGYNATWVNVDFGYDIRSGDSSGVNPDFTWTTTATAAAVAAAYKAAAGGGGGALDVDGVSTVNFTGGATQRAALNSAGTATATFVGAGTMAGALSSVGTSTVNFVGAQVERGALSVDGVSTATFVGAVAGNTNSGDLQSDGVSTVNFVGAATHGGALSSAGTSTVNFTGADTQRGALSIDGISTVNFEGAQQGVATGELYVVGTSTVNFVGEAIGGGVVVPENPLLAGGAVGYHSAGDRRKRKIKAQDEQDLADITYWLENEYFRKAA